jgi:hypothetical protein
MSGDLNPTKQPFSKTLSADTIKSRENVAFLRLLGVYTEGSLFFVVGKSFIFINVQIEVLPEKQKNNYSFFDGGIKLIRSHTTIE